MPRFSIQDSGSGRELKTTIDVCDVAIELFPDKVSEMVGISAREQVETAMVIYNAVGFEPGYEGEKKLGWHTTNIIQGEEGEVDSTLSPPPGLIAEPEIFIHTHKGEILPSYADIAITLSRQRHMSIAAVTDEELVVRTIKVSREYMNFDTQQRIDVQNNFNKSIETIGDVVSWVIDSKHLTLCDRKIVKQNEGMPTTWESDETWGFTSGI